MRPIWLIACGIAACGFARTLAAGTFAFSGAADRSGDLQGPLEIANDFSVTSPTGINVTQLGIFIDGFDGFSGLSESHVISLYSRANSSTPLATVTIGSSFDSLDGPYAYNNPQNSNSISPQTQGGWGYVNIPQLFLPNGFQGSIVAYKMSDGQFYTDDYGDSVPFHTGSGLISFVKSYHLATSSTSGDTLSGISNEVLGAGSFTFAAAPVSTPEPAVLSLLALSTLGLLRRKRTGC